MTTLADIIRQAHREAWRRQRLADAVLAWERDRVQRIVREHTLGERPDIERALRARPAAAGDVCPGLDESPIRGMGTEGERADT